MEALIIVDMQNDFNKDGKINIGDLGDIISNINELLNKFQLVIFTMDSHPSDHCSFKKYGGLWNEHCITGTDGEKIIYDIDIKKIKGKTFFVKKGFEKEYDCYSAFKQPVQKNIKYSSEILQILKDYKVEEVYVCGVAGEHCVKSTALDAVCLGFYTNLIIDSTKFIDQNKKFEVIQELKMNKIWVVKTESVLSFLDTFKEDG